MVTLVEINMTKQAYETLKNKGEASYMSNISED